MSFGDVLISDQRAGRAESCLVSEWLEMEDGGMNSSADAATMDTIIRNVGSTAYVGGFETVRDLCYFLLVDRLIR